MDIAHARGPSNTPVGSASQDAAIAAIYELGIKHQFLETVALQGLESLLHIEPKQTITNKYLEKTSQTHC